MSEFDNERIIHENQKYDHAHIQYSINTNNEGDDLFSHYRNFSNVDHLDSDVHEQSDIKSLFSNNFDDERREYEIEKYGIRIPIYQLTTNSYSHGK